MSRIKSRSSFGIKKRRPRQRGTEIRTRKRWKRTKLLRTISLIDCLNRPYAIIINFNHCKLHFCFPLAIIPVCSPLIISFSLFFYSFLNYSLIFSSSFLAFFISFSIFFYSSGVNFFVCYFTSCWFVSTFFSSSSGNTSLSNSFYLCIRDCLVIRKDKSSWSSEKSNISSLNAVKVYSTYVANKSICPIFIW